MGVTIELRGEMAKCLVNVWLATAKVLGMGV